MNTENNMVTEQNSLAVRRRALNIVWTAAGEYGFEPVYLAFTQDGTPDFYMNSIIGYVYKWYDRQTMDGLFDMLDSAFLRETFDGLLWIALENCAFLRELESRPVLSELRQTCAEDFFRHEWKKSRQQWMAQNSLIYTLWSARWRTVLGKNSGLLNPWERSLFEELSFCADWDAKQIREHMTDILHRYFRFSPGRILFCQAGQLRNRIRNLFNSSLPSKIMRSENLIFGQNRDGSVLITENKGKRTGLISAAEEENNRIYIENCFGLPLYSREENDRLEQLLCKGSHAGCRLYFTDGRRPAFLPSDSLIRKTLRSEDLQAQKNASHYKEKKAFYHNMVTRLTEQIKNALFVYPQPLRIPARTGLFIPSAVWKGTYINDDRIFAGIIREEEPDFSVDLLLDASASRMEDQPVIASQAFVIARSLTQCHIPVQVSSFLSIRGCTVIRRHCGYNGTDRQKRIFDYFAAGWNRDGLALRGAASLMESSPCRSRLLILLTDASPNDDRRIPPGAGNSHPFGSDYSGDAGIEDTAAEVRALGQRGIRVMAILNGEDGNSQAARRIYGEAFVRIKNLSGLSDAVGTLLSRQIEKLHRF